MIRIHTALIYHIDCDEEGMADLREFFNDQNIHYHRAPSSNLPDMYSGIPIYLNGCPAELPLSDHLTSIE